MKILNPYPEGSFNPKKLQDIPENFSFGGKIATASRFLGQNPFGYLASSPPSISGTPRDSHWSADGKKLAIACVSAGPASSLSWYTFNGTAFTKMPDPIYPPGYSILSSGENSHSVAFSPDCRYLAVGHVGYPYVSVYDITYPTPELLTTPDIVPPSVIDAGEHGSGVSWSPDGQYLAVSITASPYVYVYSIDNLVMNSFGSLDIRYSSDSTDIEWSPDGKHIVVGYMRPPYIGVYKFHGNRFERLPTPENVPTEAVTSVSWSPDGRYIAAGHIAYPGVTTYTFDGRLSKRLVSPTPIMPVNGSNQALVFSVCWSVDGRYLVALSDLSPSMNVYSFDETSLTRINRGVEIPASTTRGCSFSPDGNYFSVGSQVFVASPGYLSSGTLLDLSAIQNSPF